ncbi:M91 family zinc metallopeptidase [Pseudomonas sp. 18175]|uniref:M91 family zinc metallopeptidase n=1 Tax=Pseudomonas sp. 18175 TaxID=3390056 RepID=UPI003D1E92DB
MSLSKTPPLSTHALHHSSALPAQKQPEPPLEIDGSRFTNMSLLGLKSFNKSLINNGEDPIPLELAGKSRFTTDQQPKQIRQIEYHPIFKDDTIEVTRACSVSYDEDDSEGQAQQLIDQLIITTSNTADTVHIKNTANGNLTVNGKPYNLTLEPGQVLVIKTRGGNDDVTIDPAVDWDVTVEGGDDDDVINALGSGIVRVFGGKGNDFIRLGSGLGYAEGNDDNDVIYAGPGKCVVYGNNGRDRVYGYLGPGAGDAYLDGGNDNDYIRAGSSRTVINSGAGNNVLQGNGRTTFYSGSGQNRIMATGEENRIFAKKTDAILRTATTERNWTTPTTAGSFAFSVEGSADFKQRFNDDLEMLRSSPTGQKMLAELDALAKRSDSPIKVIEGESENNSFYMPNSAYFNQQLENGENPDIANDPKLGTIVANTRGDPMPIGTLVYNPHYFSENALPLTYLFHELAHAYNFKTGTVFSGKKGMEPNVELQAVGLPTSAAPFDFDDDPATPPVNTNPDPFNENALRKEMDVPLRESYLE